MGTHCSQGLKVTRLENSTLGMTDAAPPRFLRLPEVKSITGRSKAEIYRMIARKAFPESHRQSHKLAVWYEHEVAAWIAERMQQDARLTA